MKHKSDLVSLDRSLVFDKSKRQTEKQTSTFSYAWQKFKVHSKFLVVVEKIDRAVPSATHIWRASNQQQLDKSVQLTDLSIW